jgi:hypothetical protein
MHENRWDECGVLGVLKYKPDVLKLNQSCCAGGGCNPCSKFATTLQAQAEEVEKTLLNLRAAQQSLISDINFHHSPFIRDIPNEVVCIIFSFCHDPVTPKRSEESLDQSRRFCMLTLGAVCRKWREIAWTTPELWTFMRMPDVPDNNCSSSFSLQVELAKEWLDRTANLPLSISLETQVRVPSRNFPDFNPHVGELIRVLNLHSRRWQCFDIYIPMMYFPLFYNLPSESAQNESERLQHLRLDGFQLHHDHKSRIPFNANGHLLTPTRVTLGPLHIRLLNIHWGNVTSLNCSALFVDEFLALIRFAPHMTDFTLGLVEGRDYEGLYPIPDAPFIHSQLRQLTITQLQTRATTMTDRHAVTMDTLFSKLTLPSLESFSCEFSWEREIVRWMRPPALLEFFARSLPPLRYLSLSKVTMSSADFSCLMTHVPLLEEVEIMLEEKTSCFNDFLKLLDAGQTLLRHELPIYRIPEDIRLPQLRSIKYVYRGDIEFCFDGITELFGKTLGRSSDYDDDDVFRFGDAYREPLQSLIIIIEREPIHLCGGYKLAQLGKEAVECILNLREKEGKMIEITQGGIDLIKPPKYGS